MDFGELVREALGEQSPRQAGRRCGLSHTLIAEMLHGHVPQRKNLAQFADGLGLPEDLRGRLFRVAGYRDPAAAVA